MILFWFRCVCFLFFSVNVSRIEICSFHFRTMMFRKSHCVPLQKLHIPTCRQLERPEWATRAAICVKLCEACSGAACIMAYGAARSFSRACKQLAARTASTCSPLTVSGISALMLLSRQLPYPFTYEYQNQCPANTLWYTFPCVSSCAVHCSWCPGVSHVMEFILLVQIRSRCKS